MSFKGVMRPGHVSIRVLDLAEAEVHYRDRLGLLETDRDKQGRVYYKAWDEHDKFSVVIREADSPGMDFMGFKVHSKEDLDEFEGRLKDYGCAVEKIPSEELDGCGERIRFEIATGHQIELYADKEYTGNGLGLHNPEAFRDDLKGMKVYRYDHCLLYGDDIPGVHKLFTEVLDFDLTEKIVDGDNLISVFLSCSNKAHDIAFVHYPEKNKFHHASFMLQTWEEVLHAADIMSKYEISIDIGPTRHGITRGRTIYFFDPSGNRNEVFCGDYTWYPDRPPITWDAAEIGKAIFYHDRRLNENFLGVVT
jgi:catechol 2,3-dioxygenase